MTDLIQQVNNRNITYSIASISSDNPSIKLFVYFTKRLTIEGEEVSSSLERSPMVLNMSDSTLQNLWTQLEAKILEAKQIQLDNPSLTTGSDYQGFYNSLLISQIFGLCRIEAGQNVAANAAYTDFGLALAQAINGFVNIAALQVCLNNMIAALPSETNLTDLSALLATHRIPLVIA